MNRQFPKNNSCWDDPYRVISVGVMHVGAIHVRAIHELPLQIPEQTSATIARPSPKRTSEQSPATPTVINVPINARTNTRTNTRNNCPNICRNNCTNHPRPIYPFGIILYGHGVPCPNGILLFDFQCNHFIGCERAVCKWF